jgi:hypothetical protein
MSDDSAKVRRMTMEVLAQSGSKQRYLGEVVALDDAQTTAWVQSGDCTFLAFAKSDRGIPILKVGDRVTFRIDQQRAVQVEVSAQEAEQEQSTTSNSGLVPNSRTRTSHVRDDLDRWMDRQPKSTGKLNVPACVAARRPRQLHEPG